jgi:cysteine desulfurase
MGLSKKDAKSSVRMSLGRFTTAEEVDIFLETLPPIMERLRKVAH